MAAQRERAERLSRETAALRREAAELLIRSRWWRDDALRELLSGRRWHGVRAAEPPDAEPGPDGHADGGRT